VLALLTFCHCMRVSISGTVVFSKVGSCSGLEKSIVMETQTRVESPI